MGKQSCWIHAFTGRRTYSRSLGWTKQNAVQRGERMKYGLFGTVDYDDLLERQNNYGTLFQEDDEDEAFDKWREDQLEDEEWET